MGIKEMLKITTEQNREKKKPSGIVIWIIISAAAFLIFGNISPQSDEHLPEAPDSNPCSYGKEQEERLSKILKKINGAGDVSVYISLDDGGEAVTARNEKNALEENSKADNAHKEEYETEVVLAGKEPYVVKELTPRIAGVLVVAAGASNEAVRIRIHDAVKSLYGLPSHRIQVTY